MSKPSSSSSSSSSPSSGVQTSIITSSNVASSLPTWDTLTTQAMNTEFGVSWTEQQTLREKGAGTPHTDCKLRLFGTTGEPRITYYRDSAAWCPYCQKVWILLEEKQIPYRVEKINMRSYGDKPPEFLRMVPNGLLPAIKIDNSQVQTDSLQIMLNLEQMYSGPNHKQMWPSTGSPEAERASNLMRLERALFGAWCNMVFRPPGKREIQQFEFTMSQVEEQLHVTSSPWFLEDFSIVDLTYITHVERMAASVAYWTGFKIRGEGKWPCIETWMAAFEDMPSYMATKSDYYTHVMDIPPQYGPGYFGEDNKYASVIEGSDGLSWSLPLPPLSDSNDVVEPIRPNNNPGEKKARDEAAVKLVKNHEAVVKFACRGAGTVGVKRFQAPLADPYAIANLNFKEDVDCLLRYTVHALLDGYENVSLLESTGGDEKSRSELKNCVRYLQERIGVPRDMSYPAARQLRAHLGYVMDKL